MGRKVNPIGFRLGIVTDWESKWYAERNYTEQLHEDLKIRRLILRDLTRAGISRIELERSANKVDVTLHTSKPGIVIGKQGANVERLRQMLEKEIGKKDSFEDRRDQGARDRCALDRREHRRTDFATRGVSPGDEARGPDRRCVAARRASRSRLSGRLGGAEMSRSVTEMDGRVPRSTLRADIDFGVVHAHTTYGRIGVKVWVYKGEVLPERNR